MSEKAGDMSLPDFEMYVRTNLEKSVSDAIAAKITEKEISDIIRVNHAEHAKVAVSRVLTRIKKQIRNQIELKAATAAKGCLVGSRDRYGKTSPIRYLLLSPNKKHIEVSNFGTKTIYKDNEEYPIPVPSLVTLRIVPEIQYNTWKLAGIEEITREVLSRDDLVTIMGSSEIKSKDITKDMAWQRGKDTPATPIVIYGKIARISPEVVFKRDGEDGRAEIDKILPVWIETEDGFKPCFNFGLRTPEGGKYIRCHIEHQRYGKPTLFIEEIESLCKRAVEKFPNRPEDQAAYLNEWLGEEVAVIVAGVISSYREGFDKNKKEVTNVEIGAVAVVEVKDRAEGDRGQHTVTKEAASPPLKEPAKEPVKEPAKEPAKEEPKPQPTRPSDGGPSILVKSIAEDIKLWCAAANISPSSVTIDTLKTKAASRYSDVPDGVILEAIERIKKGEI